MQQANFGHFSNTTYKRSRGVGISSGVETKSFLGTFKGAALHVRKLLSTPPASELVRGGTTEKEEKGSLSLSPTSDFTLSLTGEEGEGGRGGREREREQGGRPLLSDEKEEERSERKHSRFGSL